jgi:prepilin-type N-terminal cleavage/methylation domain-containing protein
MTRFNAHIIRNICAPGPERRAGVLFALKNRAQKTPCLKRRAGMTLIEVLVAMAIIAVVSVMCLQSFTTVLKSEERETKTKNEAEAVERQIADGAEPQDSVAADLKLTAGGEDFTLSSNADAYSEGDRGYSVLDVPQPETPGEWALCFGHGAATRAAISAKSSDQLYAYETTYLGGTMEVTVPYSGRYRLEVWGAHGSGVDYSDTLGASYDGGGDGGYATGVVTLKKGEKLYLYAGGKGLSYRSLGEKQGGFNGGGNIMTGWLGGSCGGGASDVRIGTDSLYARVIVAGGGGGGGFSRTPSAIANEVGIVTGGDAGGLVGYDGTKPLDAAWKAYAVGLGGTQSAGGGLDGRNDIVGYNNGSGNNGTGAYYLATAGSFGAGGQGVGDYSPYGDGAGGAGGGGGWYGGGGGCINAAGGGSSWVFTQAAMDGWTNDADKANWLLDTKYFLSDTRIVDGKGVMPNPLSTTGGTMTGSKEGGFVMITFLDA